jgi:cell division cycle 20-like protein 1, cofactor of APC complex
VAKCKRLRVMEGHHARVGTMAWNSHILSSGSRDRVILNRDVRAKDAFMSKLAGHKQEVCGLKWSPDSNQLASGGNDNKLFIWSPTHNSEPIAQ